jgi:peptide chain release factor 2
MNYASASRRSVNRSASSGGIFDFSRLTSELQDLERQTAQPDFWSNTQNAARVNRKKSSIEREIRRWADIERQNGDLSALLQLAEESGDAELARELEASLRQFEQSVGQLRIELLLSGEHDISNALVAIHPGAGGTESQDWAQMLMRMYIRWAERKGYKVAALDLQAGEGAGIKSATLSITGPYAYGYLKAEAGVHRLVRISPFDANKRRHTSFASVFVYPELDDDTDIAIDEKDLRIDTFRSGGAGGQNVNKVETAIRITHIPTNLVAQCQNERSQLQNRMGAMKILKAKLFELEEQKKQEKFNAIVGEKKGISWGSQIRSYVFQPYQMVKDLRTGVETGQVDAVMDGGIDQFIEAYLKRQLTGQGQAQPSTVGPEEEE